MKTNLTQQSRYRLVERLFILIDRDWDPAKVVALSELKEALAGSDVERYFLGHAARTVRDLFLAIYVKFVGRVAFYDDKPAQIQIRVVEQNFAQLSNAERWAELRKLLMVISEEWDEEEVERYDIDLSFDEAIGYLTGVRFFKED